MRKRNPIMLEEAQERLRHINICLLYTSSGVEHHLAKVGAAGSNPVSRFFVLLFRFIGWALILSGFPAFLLII